MKQPTRAILEAGRVLAAALLVTMLEAGRVLAAALWSTMLAAALWATMVVVLLGRPRDAQDNMLLVLQCSNLAASRAGSLEAAVPSVYPDDRGEIGPEAATDEWRPERARATLEHLCI